MNIIEHNWNWAHGLSSRSATDAIVIHHAAADSATPEGIHAYHLSQGWAGIGYHLYIRKNGEVHRGRPIWASGAQVMNHNYHTLGVCCEGNYHVKGAVMPRAQMDALHEAIRYCKGLYPSAVVKFHRDYGGSVCPGDYFPYAEALNYETAGETAEREEADMNEAEVRKIVQDVLNGVDTKPSEWAEGEVEAAKALGITDGSRPQGYLKREEAFALFVRFNAKAVSKTVADAVKAVLEKIKGVL